MPQLDLYLYIIPIAIVIGFIRFRRLESLLKTFPFFLLLTLFVECATPFHWIRFRGNNSWFFNIFTTIEFLYYSFIFYHILERSLIRTIIRASAIGLLVFTVLNIFFIQGFRRFHTISYRAGAI